MMPRPSPFLSLAAALALAVCCGPARAGDFGVALEQALLGSKAVAASRADLRAAVEELPVARSTMTLTTELSVSKTRADTTTEDEEFSSDTESASLTLRQPIYDGGVAGSQRKISEFDVERARIQLRLTEQSVLLAAIDAYVGLVVARDRMELEQANARRLDEYLRATLLRVELGEATPTDLAATQAQQARAEASLISAEAGLANAEQTYFVALDASPAPGLTLPDPPAGIPASAEAAGDEAIEGNHAHRLAHVAERTARLQLDLLAANVRPTVALSLTGRTVEDDRPSFRSRTADEVSADVTLSMPLAPNSAVRARARSVVASHRSAVLGLEDSERNTRLDAQNAYRDFRAASQVIDAYGAELKAAALLRDGTRSEVDFGLKTVLELLDAEQDVVNAQVNLLEANRNRIVAAYRLLATVGRLSAADLGLDADVARPDDREIRAPIVLRPLPVLRYDE